MKTEKDNLKAAKRQKREAEKDEREREGKKGILESLQKRSIRVVFVVCEKGCLTNYMVLNGMGAITRCVRKQDGIILIV